MDWTIKLSDKGLITVEHDGDVVHALVPSKEHEHKCRAAHMYSENEVEVCVAAAVRRERLFLMASFAEMFAGLPAKLIADRIERNVEEGEL